MAGLDQLLSGPRGDAPREAPLLPDLPIIDAHHHFWDIPGSRYLFDELSADVNAGHNIVSTVFVECRTMYPAAGPEEEKPIAEMQFASGMAAMSATGNYGKTRICDAILGALDLRLGDRVEPLLHTLLGVAGSRFKGIRKLAFHDPDPMFHVAPYGEDKPGVLLDPRFNDGVRVMAAHGLSIDVAVYFTQLADVAELARRNPDVTIVLNHLGLPIGSGSYAARHDEVLATWHAGLANLAQRDNVRIKLGGLATPIVGCAYHADPGSPSSSTLAAAWKPFVMTGIDLFGPERCMFESNAPVDLASCGYNELWNAFKRICEGASTAEINQLFWRTAAQTYRLHYPELDARA